MKRNGAAATAKRRFRFAFAPFVTFVRTILGFSGTMRLSHG